MRILFHASPLKYLIAGVCYVALATAMASAFTQGLITPVGATVARIGITGQKGAKVVYRKVLLLGVSPGSKAQIMLPDNAKGIRYEALVVFINGLEKTVAIVKVRELKP